MTILRILHSLAARNPCLPLRQNQASFQTLMRIKRKQVDLEAPNKNLKVKVSYKASPLLLKVHLVPGKSCLMSLRLKSERNTCTCSKWDRLK